METGQPGHVILLNGVSSSGKSSIARALLPLLAEPWFHLSVDAVSAMRSTVQTQDLPEHDLGDILRRTRLGYHRMVAALASVGNNVVMDYPLSESWRVSDLVQVLAGYDVTVVEVRCSHEELVRRERERTDRPVGLAESQTRVHSWGAADMVVDTTNSSPQHCARAIADAYPNVASPKAFARLR